MKEYMEAHRERMQRNHDTLIKMASELKARGCRILASEFSPISFIRVLKGNKHISLCFNELPYHWTLEMEYNPQDGHGSGRRIDWNYNTENTWSADYIISKMVENPKVKNFENPFHLAEIQ